MTNFGLSTGPNVPVEESPTRVYEANYREIRALAQTLMNRLREMETIRVANPEIEEAINAATSDDEYIGDSTLKKSSAINALALAQSLGQWANTPLANGLRPIMIMFRKD